MPMQKCPEDRFTIQIRPLFKRRRIFRILSTIFIVLSLVTYESILFVFIAIPTAVFVFELIKIESNLKHLVWQRFSEQLDYTLENEYIDYSQTLGVIGSLGDKRSVKVIVQGAYKAYKIRVINQLVNFKPNSKFGYYSRSYRILEISTKQNFYNVFIDSKQNHNYISSSAMKVLSSSLRNNPKLLVEGDVNKYFNIYVPKSDNHKSLITLSPEKLIALRDYGTNFDIEFVGNKIYLITDAKIKSYKDIMIYQESALNLIKYIGVDITRNRNDNTNNLIVKNPIALTL